MEVLGTQADDGALRYTLTDRGRALAAIASEINGYAGAAPIPLDMYLQLVAAQFAFDELVRPADDGDFIARLQPGARIWMSDPTWANHNGIFRAAGLELSTYPYYNHETKTLNFDEMNRID